MLTIRSFGQAVAELTRSSMVDRHSETKALSTHRLVQLVVFSKLSESRRVELFDLTVKLLYLNFPNTWQARGPHQGHGYASWEACESVLLHVRWLMQLSTNYQIKSEIADKWAELVFRLGTYVDNHRYWTALLAS